MFENFNNIMSGASATITILIALGGVLMGYMHLVFSSNKKLAEIVARIDARIDQVEKEQAGLGAPVTAITNELKEIKLTLEKSADRAEKRESIVAEKAEASAKEIRDLFEKIGTRVTVLEVQVEKKPAKARSRK